MGPFAYADNYIDDKKYDNFLIDQSYNAEIKIDENSLIIEKETAEEIRRSIGNTEETKETEETEEDNEKIEEIEEKRKVFTGNIDLNGSNFSRTANEIYIDIIEVLNSSLNRKIDISIDIRAEDPDGFDKNTERLLKENATNLNFKIIILNNEKRSITVIIFVIY